MRTTEQFSSQMRAALSRAPADTAAEIDRIDPDATAGIDTFHRTA
jgi:hypothetical protein